MESRHHLEVATGNLKMSQVKSQLEKSKLDQFFYSNTLREVATNH